MHSQRGKAAAMLAALVAIGLFLVAIPSTSTAQVIAASSTSDTGQVDHDSRAAHRGNNFRGGGATVGCICGTTGRMSVVTRGGSKPTKQDFIAAGKKQGLKITKVGKVTGFKKKFRSFTPRHVRHNLSMHTGFTRLQSDAHHIMPKKFDWFFAPRGININHPKNLTWWYRPSHQKFASRYNREWAEWIRRNPNASKSQVLRRAQYMRAKFAGHYSKPLPGGCKVVVCRPAY